MPSRRTAAYTLVELLGVVVILAIVAALTVPLLISATPQKVDAVAEEVAGALRYARSLAMETGQAHGVNVDPLLMRVTVYQADVSSGTIVQAQTVAHPQSGLPYAFDVDAVPGAEGIWLLNLLGPFGYAGLFFPRSDVVFQEEGLPVYWEAGVLYGLADGQVWVGRDGHVRTVRLRPNGRVTLE